MTMSDPDVVRREYASESGLLARRAIYAHATGPDPTQLVVDAVAEASPRRCLEVGCGPGELAAVVQERLAAEVVALDVSPRMVELARARGVEALVGDVQELPFADAEFDCAVAAWMLYHVPDPDRALAELARVLRKGGRLVAATTSIEHLRELRELVGFPPLGLTFRAENGAELLERHFRQVERRDGAGRVTFPDRDAVVARVRASETLAGCVADVPDFEGPFVATTHFTIFVATV